MTTPIEDLYAQEAPRARRLAYLLTGDLELAEDLVHDCFVKLASRLRPLDDPAAYLRRMVVNATRTHHRRTTMRRSHHRREAAVVGADTDTAPDGSEQRADRARLLAALADLPERQRAAVVLRHWLDLSEAQVADELGCSVGTVKSLASRGRAALRLVLEDA